MVAGDAGIHGAEQSGAAEAEEDDHTDHIVQLLVGKGRTGKTAGDAPDSCGQTVLQVDTFSYEGTQDDGHDHS